MSGAKLKNKLARQWSATGKTLRTGLSRNYDRLRVKLGGLQALLSAHKLAQKKRFKELHQKTFLQEQAVRLSSGNAADAARWTPQAKVNRDLFTRNTAEYVTKCIIRWETATSDQREKLVFVKNGRPAHIFSLPFFNDADADENEQISWVEFKKNVFYAYVRGLAQSIQHVSAEIEASRKVHLAFKELREELPAGQQVTYGDLKPRLQSYGVFPAHSKIWQADIWADDHAKSEVTLDAFIKQVGNKKSIEELQLLKKELVEEIRISINRKSLKLTRPGAESKPIPYDGAVASSQPSLSQAESNASQTADDDDNSSDDEDDDDETRLDRSSLSNDDPASRNSAVVSVSRPSLSSKKGGAAASAGDSDSVAEPSISRVSQGTENSVVARKPLSALTGFPRTLADKLHQQPALTRNIARKLHAVLRAKNEQNPLEAAKILLNNSAVLFTKELEQCDIYLEQERQKHALSLKRAKSDAHKAALAQTLQQAESDVDKRRLAVKQQYLVLQEVFKQNHRLEVKKLRRIAAASAPLDGSDSTTADVQLTSVEAFQAQLSLISKYYHTKTTAEHELPPALDYSSQVHEPFAQSTDEHGFLFALTLIKEWQEFSNVHLTQRLSVDFLKQAISEYNPGGAASWSLLDGLEVLRTVGVALESFYETFAERKDRDTAKARARIRTHANSFMIDRYLKVKDAYNLKSAMWKYGPALITLPVYDKKATYFWRAPAVDAPVLGYHTLVILGYDDFQETLLLRNSRGKAWGKFGNAHISYQEAFQSSKHIQIVMVVDGDSRVANSKDAGAPAADAQKKLTEITVKQTIATLSQQLKQLQQKP